MSQVVQHLSFLGHVLVVQWILGSLLVSVVALGVARMPALNAATRHAVWSVVLAVLAVLPVCLTLPWPEPVTPVAPAHAAPAPAVAGGAPAVEPTAVGQGIVPPAVSGDRWSPPWSPVLAGLALCWMLAVVRRASLLASALVRTRLRYRQSVRISGEPAAVLRSLAAGAGLGTTPELRCDARLSAPALFGWWRPWLALPPRWLDGVSESVRDHALLHELAHLVRRDGPWTLVERTLALPLALHPTAWWVLRRLELERESACDDWVMERDPRTASKYAESLVECLASSIREPDDVLAAGWSRSPKQMKRRLLNMQDQRRSHAATKNRWTVAGAVLVLAVAALATTPVWPALPPASSGPTTSTEGVDRAGIETMSADHAPLYAAIRNGNLERVRRMLEAGEPADQIWPGDGSPLIVAAGLGREDLVDLLLRHGATVDLGVGGDGTPLIQAASSGNLELVDLLLAAGADIDHHGRGGDGNPLIQAAMEGDLAMARHLVERGAAVDVQVRGDDTPLINAVRHGGEEMVAYLLSLGADPGLEGDWDRRLETVRTPLNQARAHGTGRMVEMLLEAGARD